VEAKDIILSIIGQIGTGGGAGSAVEYAGDTIQALSVEERMTVCNMSIEGGARAGMIAPDKKTFEYLRGRRYSPAAFEVAVEKWKQLPSDPGASFDRTLNLDASTLSPQVTWGTNPGQVVAVDSRVPDPSQLTDPNARKSAERALAYMDLKAGPLSRTFRSSASLLAPARIHAWRICGVWLTSLREAGFFWEGPGSNHRIHPGRNPPSLNEVSHTPQILHA